MYILGVHTGHDANACIFKDNALLAYCKEERLTREKNCKGNLDMGCIDEALRIAGLTRKDIDHVAFTRMKFPLDCYIKTSRGLKDKLRKLFGSKRSRNLFSELKRNKADVNTLLDESKVKKRMNLRDDVSLSYCNHHYAHVLGSLQYTDWEDALYISCDGGGDGAFYSAYALHNNQLKSIYGGEETLNQPQNQAASIGLVYAHVTYLLGFIPNRHEGKVTGLAAFGKPTLAPAIIEKFNITEQGGIETHFKNYADMTTFLHDLTKGHSREDVACSVQNATEEIICQWVLQLLKLHPTKHIGLSGGVFANVRVNQKVCELPGVEEVFIFPAMSDEGLSVGACVEVNLERAGVAGLERSRMRDVYFGYPYDGKALMARAREKGLNLIESSNIAQLSAEKIAKDEIGAIYAERMEMGPRALGARSIIASPQEREINQRLNDRLQRTEFMPFAPYVLEEDAETVFEINDANRYACEFMTITTDVKPAYRDSIPAVVHVDGTARPQIIKRDKNPLYYDILKHFKEITGMVCLVNTSFNAHEEPIINTPDEAIQALLDKRIDFLVCDEAIITL